MKIFKLLAVAALALGFTSCNDDDDQTKSYAYNFTFDLESDQYNADGYWKDVYNTTVTEVPLSPAVTATHSASVSEWDGVEYKSWNGFCPSISTDNADHSADEEGWTPYQWGAITTTRSSMYPGYLLGFWNVYESKTDYVANPSCALNFTTPGTPVSIYVTNSAYGYYIMKNGSAFSHAFENTDWCKLYIKGVRGGAITGTITVYLAREGQILDEWLQVDLSGLGVVDQIYFQMESTDEGEWGMNNPAYFCLENLTMSYDIDPFAE
jgi:hypothetical protein